jgi:thymidylate synthase (FAD)
LIECLDHGFVRLVDFMGSDVSIARAARVSYDAAWRAGEDQKSDARLINYLWKNGHTSPFESVTCTFEVKAPIFVLRQWHRHRTLSYNELSARYRELPQDYYLPEPDKVGVQSTDNKQVRDLKADPFGVFRAQRGVEISDLAAHCRRAFEIYHDLLGKGWPRELARMVLPLNTYSQMFTTMNLLNLFRFLALRLHPHAQYEISVYAKAMHDLIQPVAPVAVAAWDKYRVEGASHAKMLEGRTTL